MESTLIQAVRDHSGMDDEQIIDAGQHGADAGWPGFTYYNDTIAFYDQHEDAIYEFAADYADQMGYDNIPSLVASFRRANDCDSVTGYKNLMAWFVLEHLNDTNKFLKALAQKPSGTIFIFSVPVFGVAHLIERVCMDIPARGIDNVFHTQVFTDESIAYIMKNINYDVVAEWIFGQDVADWYVQLHQQIQQLPESLREKFNAQIIPLLDPMQILLDRKKLSDQRHLIAIKR